MAPRGFTDQERDHIRARLLGAGRAQFSSHGLRRTTVADLARAANIAKGSFYLFFPSKEALFFAIMEQLEQEHREPPATIAPRAGETPREMVRRSLAEYRRMFEEHPILLILADPQELEALTRGMPPDQVKAHLEGDDGYLTEVVRAWQRHGVAEGRDPVVVAGILKAVVMLNLQRELIGPGFEAMMTLLAEVLAIGLTEGNAP